MAGSVAVAEEDQRVVGELGERRERGRHVRHRRRRQDLAGTLRLAAHDETHVVDLRECATPYIPSANIATSQPVDVAIALVDDATDARTELYRGTFPVFAFSDWKGNGDNGPVHVEQRALRLDSFLGAAFVRQYLGNELQFSYVDIRNVAEVTVTLQGVAGSGRASLC